MTLKELSKRTGIPLQTLYFWKRNTRKIPLGKLSVLAKEMKLSDEEIIKAVKRGETNALQSGLKVR